VEWPDHQAILTLLFSFPLFSSRSLASSRRAAFPAQLSVVPRYQESMWPWTSMNFSGLLEPSISATVKGILLHRVSVLALRWTLTGPSFAISMSLSPSLCFTETAVMSGILSADSGVGVPQMVVTIISWRTSPPQMWIWAMAPACWAAQTTAGLATPYIRAIFPSTLEALYWSTRSPRPVNRLLGETGT